MSVPGTYTKVRAIGDIEAIWEEDTQHVLLRPDGRTMTAMIAIIPEEDFPMLKQGYACAQCLTKVSISYPENCPTCNFPMREYQTEYIAKMYQGNRKTGPSTSLEDEKLIMQEMREREARELGIWTPPGTWM